MSFCRETSTVTTTFDFVIYLFSPAISFKPDYKRSFPFPPVEQLPKQLVGNTHPSLMVCDVFRDRTPVHCQITPLFRVYMVLLNLSFHSHRIIKSRR